MKNPSSRRRSLAVHRLLLTLRDRFYPELEGVAPSSEWVGPMAFTPDRLPAIGALKPGIIIAAGFNGYGGSYTTAAGFAAAAIALDDRTPDWVPDDVFSPHRLLSSQPIFMAQRDSVWRIAASLCRQLKSVNKRISDALTLRTEPVDTVRVRRSQAMMAVAESASGDELAPELLLAFPAFEKFTRAEVKTLLASTRMWQLRAGTLLFTEGSPGGSCFIIIRGAVDVSIEIHGQHQVIAHLRDGEVFGQVSLIDGEPRSATCTIHDDSLLVELEREACERLLDERSPFSLKLLGVLNDGLIAALRGADRTLVKIEEHHGHSRRDERARHV